MSDILTARASATKLPVRTKTEDEVVVVVRVGREGEVIGWKWETGRVRKRAKK